MFRNLLFLQIIVLFPLVAICAPQNPIVFVGQVPQPEDFATIGSTFANHEGGLQEAPRGGGLFIRYTDGSVRDLTTEAGYGQLGLQGNDAIAVRDPEVHWDANKVVFSMVVGAPSEQYQVQSYRWQLYEISGLRKNQTPVITYLEGQPSQYNNIMPVYTSQDDIIYVSDCPRGRETHLYPQLDEYESTPTNTGLWLLDVSEQSYEILDHAPSGVFHPYVDSYGRVIFSRWDHLQRDQQAITNNFGAIDYDSESTSASTQSAQEMFPEPWAQSQIEFAGQNIHRINQFFPWEINQDGSALETLNHVGRQELKDYGNRSFNNDDNLEEIIAGVTPRLNQNSLTNMFHISESRVVAGEFYGTSAPEFGTHSAGQLVTINGQKGLSADDMRVLHLTHPDTAQVSNNPGANHTGLYRDPLPLSNGELVATHTSETRADNNDGSRANPRSRYDFRIKLLSQSGSYFEPQLNLTSGISRTISFWDPDVLVSFSGNLWELQAVELVARSRPDFTMDTLPTLETSLFDQEGVDEEQFREYLRSNDLALFVSRDVTSRDAGDKQQPYNLRVTNSTTQTIATGGKIYDVESLQIVQGDSLRAYTNHSSGRRIIPRPLHDVSVLAQPNIHPSQDGAVSVSADGSVAALVPAGRALSWQLLDQNGNEVVRERYWLTFKSGEIRVCASCHGLNSKDQIGRSVPENSPVAFQQVLRWFKQTGGLPGELPSYDMSVVKVAKRIRPKKSVSLELKGLNDEAVSKTLEIRLRVGKKTCKSALGSVTTSANGNASLNLISGRTRGKHKLRFSAYYAGREVGMARASYKGKAARGTSRKKLKKKARRALCKSFQF